MKGEDLLTLAFKPFADWLCDLLNIKSGEEVLDVGCGRGMSTAAVLEKVLPDGYVVGVDADNKAINRLQSKFSREGRARFLVSQAEKLDNCFGNEEFDAVISNYSFHLFADMEKALEQMLYVLKPRGRLGATVPGADHVVEFRKILMVMLKEFGLLEEFEEYGPLVMDREKLTSLVEEVKGKIEAYKILDKKFIIEVENAKSYVKHMEARNAKTRILNRIPQHLHQDFWGEIQHHMNLVYGVKKVPMTLHGLALILQKNHASRMC